MLLLFSSSMRTHRIWKLFTIPLILISLVFGQMVLAQNQKIYSDTFIEISIDGGGFYGGINPTTVNKKVIKNSGEVLITRKQLYSQGETKIVFITRDKAEELAKFILDKNFFEVRDIYDCDENNQKCKDRKRHYPPAVPLRIDVTIGNWSKKVVITVYEKGMIDYPQKIEEIVTKINEVINED